jgi:flagellar basal body P-ring formation protein FlgA
MRARLLLSLLLVLPSAHARQDPLPVRQAVERFLYIQTQSLAGEVRIQVGEFAADNQLQACDQLEAFLPPGARAWGRSSIGVRCLAPSPWTAFVPAQISVRGPYLVSAGPLPAGQPIAPADLRQEIGDLTTLPVDTLGDPSRAVGHIPRQPLAAGKPLSASLLRLPPAVLQGQMVRVLTRGVGFQVATEGQALATATDGQNIPVRLANGQVIRGTARHGGQVEVPMP